MVKICFFTYMYLPEAMEGSAIYLHKIASHLVKRGFDVVVLARSKSDNIVKTEIDGVKIYLNPSLSYRWGNYYRTMDKLSTYQVSSFKGLWRECIDADILQILSASMFFPLGYAIKKINKIPVITTIIEDIWSKPTSPWINLYLRYQGWQLGMALRHSDTVVVQSERSYKYISRYRNYSLKVRLISSFIESNLFNPTVRPSESFIEKYRKDGWFIILVPQRLVWIKGVDIAIKAFRTVIEKIQNVKMLIVGDGPLKWDLKLLIRKMALEEYIDFIGEVDHYNEMPKYYALADVVVVPSRSEASQPPATVAEPMAMEKPVIISKSCDTEHVLKDTVRVFKDEDIEGLAAEIITLLSDGRLREKIGIKARRKIIERCSTETFLSNYDEIYNEMLNLSL